MYLNGIKYGGKRLAVITCSIVVLISTLQTVGACPCADLKIPAAPASDIDPVGGLAYMKTPEYKKEFAAAIEGARKACMKHLGEPDVAIVSDIDETCLDNSAHFKDGTGWGDWEKWEAQAKDPVLKQTADFLAWARKNGFAVFFITGRSESSRAATIKNLVRAGLSYDGLYMRPHNDDLPAEPMKSKFRKMISDMGFKIIVNIGDQYSDLTGGYAEDCEKLPNKIYYIH